MGHSVEGCSRRTGCDAGDIEKLKPKLSGCDLVYHLAADARPAESILAPRETIEANLRTTISVALACSNMGLPLVFASSCEIYGNSSGRLTEGSPVNPTNPYAASKASCDRALFSFHESYGLDVKIPRLFNPYGPGQQLNKVIPTFYRQAVQGKPLTVYGTGTDTRDYVYIDDIVDGLWRARKLPAGEAVNLATGVSTTTREVAEMVISKTASKSVINFVPYPRIFGGIKNQVGSFEKAESVMGWRPKTSLSSGLERTIDWLESLNGT